MADKADKKVDPVNVGLTILKYGALVGIGVGCLLTGGMALLAIIPFGLAAIMLGLEVYASTVKPPPEKPAIDAIHATNEDRNKHEQTNKPKNTNRNINRELRKSSPKLTERPMTRTSTLSEAEAITLKTKKEDKGIFSKFLSLFSRTSTVSSTSTTHKSDKGFVRTEKDYRRP